MKFNTYVEICEMPEGELAGRTKIVMTALEIYKDKTQYNGNGITWLEEYVQNNIDSLIGCPYVTAWLDEENQIPYDHGEMTYDEDGNVQFEGVTVGSIQDASIEDMVINGENKRVLKTVGFIYNQRYPLFVDWLKQEVKNGTVFGSIEINGKAKNKKIEYLDGDKNTDGSLKMGRVPTVFDFSGLAILNMCDPADNASVVIEVNSKKDGEQKLPKQKAKIKNPQVIEINEMSYDDIAVLVSRAFNKAMSNSDEYGYCYDYEIYKFYPASGRIIMKKWSAVNEFYMTTYTVQNSNIALGEIIQVEQDWKPIEDEVEVEINKDFIKDIITNGQKEVIKKMDEKVVAELNKQIEDKSNELTELNAKVSELNESIVNANKMIEESNEKNKNLEDELNACKSELNAFKEKEATEKAEKEKAEAKAEVNTYFENEISKNGFNKDELDSLNDYVEKCDLEGLKKAEAELCVKKVKDGSKAKEEDVETNSKKMFIEIPEAKKKIVSENKISFFHE